MSDDQFELFNKALEEINKTKQDNVKKRDVEGEEIQKIISDWYHHRRKAYGLNKPTAEEFNRHKCSLKCISDMSLISEKYNIYICHTGGIYHVCKSNETCKDRYQGTDGRFYCLFSKNEVDIQYIMDDISHPGFQKKIRKQTELETSEMNEYYDEDDDDYENEFTENLEDVYQEEDEQFIKKQKLDYNEIKPINSKKGYITKNVDYSKDMLIVKKNVTSPRTTRKRDKKINKDGTIKKNGQKNIISLLKHAGRPDYLDELGKEAEHDYIIKLIEEDEEYQIKTDDSESEKEDDIDNDEDDHYNNKIIKKSLKELIPIIKKKYEINSHGSIWNTDEMNKRIRIHDFSIVCFNTSDNHSIQRHILRQGDTTLNNIKSVIDDLLFDNKLRSIVNQKNLRDIKEQAESNVKRYYKKSISLNERPITITMDDIYDGTVSSRKILPMVERDHNFVDYLCALIMDMWFLIISTKYYFENSSRFHIKQHTIAMLYLMKDDYVIDVITNTEKNTNIIKDYYPSSLNESTSDIPNTITDCILIHKHPIMNQILPSQNDLKLLSSEKNRNNKYGKNDNTKGRNNINKSLLSISDPQKREKYVLEYKNRVILHRKQFLKNKSDYTLKMKIK